MKIQLLGNLDFPDVLLWKKHSRSLPGNAKADGNKTLRDKLENSFNSETIITRWVIKKSKADDIFVSL